MKKPIRLSLILDKLFLNSFRLGASTVHWSSRFHLLTTLFEKMPSDKIYAESFLSSLSFFAEWAPCAWTILYLYKTITVQHCWTVFMCEHFWRCVAGIASSAEPSLYTGRSPGHAVGHSKIERVVFVFVLYVAVLPSLQFLTVTKTAASRKLWRHENCDVTKTVTSRKL